jgi:hypothetical protein
VADNKEFDTNQPVVAGLSEDDIADIVRAFVRNGTQSARCSRPWP